ncbi:MAG: hypothetical protein HKN79_11815 [Flavobacteriales bacterium]|nr:hypothetical protein [Flavobacteriales bacterium]
MSHNTHRAFWIPVLAIFTISLLGFCLAPEADKGTEELSTPNSRKEFNAYWYAGKAEITTYDLEQARYGEIHPGKSVMVFVTEDFLINEQVKKEQVSDKPATSVIKLNKIDRFTTGIYDYSTMLSTFTPVDRYSYPFSLKTTFSSQDWCGQSFMQVNRRGEGYQALVRSYFEAEGDKNVILDSSLLEDEIWTLARLDPMALPQGDITIIPSSQQFRLRHQPLAPVEAEAKMTLQVRDDSSEQYIYTVDFESGRQLKIFMQSVFPYRIYGWEEKVKSGFGTEAQWLTTKATMDKSIKSSYWGQNNKADAELRESLGL